MATPKPFERLFVWTAVAIGVVLTLALIGAVFAAAIYLDRGTTTIAKLQDRLEPCRLTER